MNISLLLERNARKYPKKEAVVSESKQFTYWELNKFVNQLANSLSTYGLNKGDKVVLYMPNTPEFIISYFAVLRLGGIIVPVSAKLTSNELSYILNHSDAKALIAHDLLFDQVKDLPSSISLLFIKTGEPVDEWKSFEQLLEYGSTEEITCD